MNNALTCEVPFLRHKAFQFKGFRSFVSAAKVLHDLLRPSRQPAARLIYWNLLSHFSQL